MTIDAKQLQHLVIRPALQAIGLHSDRAEALVLNTARHESHLKYLKQLGDGPALGLWQMEPATHNDIWENFLAYDRNLARTVRQAIVTTSRRPKAERLVWDLRYGAIMCRLHYRRVPKGLPDAADLYAQADYWKQHYNTHLGAGLPQEFVENAERFA